MNLFWKWTQDISNIMDRVSRAHYGWSHFTSFAISVSLFLFWSLRAGVTSLSQSLVSKTLARTAKYRRVPYIVGEVLWTEASQACSQREESTWTVCTSLCSGNNRQGFATVLNLVIDQRYVIRAIWSLLVIDQRYKIGAIWSLLVID